MFVRKSTHDDLKEQYNELMAAHKMDLETIDAQHHSFTALANRSDEMMKENASLSLLTLDVLAWMNEIVLPANGKNRRELSSRRAEMREQALKLGILVDDVVTEDRKEEKSA